MAQQTVSLKQRWDKARPTKSVAFWIAIGAIVLTLYLGFSRGGWVTGGTARQLAETTAQDAVVARLAPICVAQFNEDPQKYQKFDELMALTTAYQRTRYVVSQGWATMPGESRPDNAVAAECAQHIRQMGE